MGDLLKVLQQWYQSKCDGTWEHMYGVEIDTLDNPGWTVSLTGETDKKSINIFVDRSEDNWLSVKSCDDNFVAYGGINNLEEILVHAVEWINS